MLKYQTTKYDINITAIEYPGAALGGSIIDVGMVQDWRIAEQQGWPSRVHSSLEEARDYLIFREQHKIAKANAERRQAIQNITHLERMFDGEDES